MFDHDNVTGGSMFLWNMKQEKKMDEEVKSSVLFKL